ncbi:hypothetical protein [Streptomyces benahoarensis]|uniref:Uncharacterized protein n=1 Tax=Streptomyces benahoarensis TaxID=2595054 RepID=A0A553Z868_9ACTN|nr:hypothetical protein [Streptomyces benahoarensis]TSB19691.1 hypothetical protein FNJ62_22040 [Streptomyces benahoarensis]TSB37639.1 hypothetical protein FNZ23_18310 [Streptomyces benahoarensis]
METVITVAVIILMIAMGMFLIHLLNAQHDERIAAFHYSEAPRGSGRRSRPSRQPPNPLNRP